MALLLGAGMNSAEKNLGYFLSKQCSKQWQAFLRAFASEFGQQIPVAELRILMARLGRSMAEEISLPAGDTIAALEESMNAIWSGMDWGWVSLVEHDDGLFVEHRLAPLQLAFGDEALTWSPAILEGIYAHWFAAMGAGSALQLTQVEPANSDACVIVFRFGR